MDKQAIKTKSFGTLPVFFTAISTILGAILFLRFGFAVGHLGFVGVLMVVFLGHLITIPTALAISEIATNQRVEGGGEYFIISRSFGLNIGATIGIALYLSQAISVAFYIIAFTEAFEPLFNWVKQTYDFTLPRQAISIPAMILLAILIIKKGASIGVKTLYFVVAILFVSLVLFFIGAKSDPGDVEIDVIPAIMENEGFFWIFAIVFPAFTGMTAGVGLSGDLKNPAKSIPAGTISATIIGMVVYVLIAWKLYISATPNELINNQLIMGKIALYGHIVIPLGLAASTLSSAIGSILVAPRTLQALGIDRSLPSPRMSRLMAKGVGETAEPYNATILTSIIALVFVAAGDVNAVAEIISMFFMVTYGSLCLISFLYHFGADPSYRPSFRSKWYISLIGFLACVWLMFRINAGYAVMAIVLMTLIYIFISNTHKNRRGLEDIFTSAIFQLSRNLQIFLQKSKRKGSKTKWRPSIICISASSFERSAAFELVNWLSFRYGFGTYIHLIEGYYSKANALKAGEILQKLIAQSEYEDSKVYVDTIISPSYTSAIAQAIQLPSISGMENNMILFEFDKENPKNLNQIIENYSLIRAGDFDICILGSTRRKIYPENGIHVWIKSIDFENSNLMILLSYIILGHPTWKKGHIKIFDITRDDTIADTRKQLNEMIQTGRLPISPNNIQILKGDENTDNKSLINQHSAEAAMVVVGFRSEQVKHEEEDLFDGYTLQGNVLFVNSYKQKELG